MATFPTTANLGSIYTPPPNVTPQQMANPQSVLNPATLSAELQSPLFNQPMLGQAAQDLYAAQGETLEATGSTEEESQFTTAAAIAGQNARLAAAAGGVTEAQQNLAINKTIGAQQAGVAGAGFANSGTNLNLLRASKQQGALTTQLTQTQTEMEQGGYLQQQSAATAEATAAGTAAQVQTNAAGEMGALGTVAYDNATAASMNNNAAAMKNSEVNFELAAARG